LKTIKNKIMTEEIRLIIEKNLPAQVGETLKAVLDQAKKDSETVTKYSEDIKFKVKVIAEKDQIIKEYQQFDTRNTQLEAREKSLDERDRNLTIETLKIQLASEKEKTDFTKSIALGLVRNTEFRRELFDSHNDNSQRDQYGNPIYTNKSQTSTETKSAE
jgi:hypothetical protein